jgi:flagellin-like protein
MRKAITPVISVILLIMLVVAITGGAWYWMTNVQGSLQESAGASIEETGDLSSTQFSIASALCGTDNVTLTLINTGSNTIASSDAILVTISTLQGAVLGTNTSANVALAGDLSAGGADSLFVIGGMGTMTLDSTYSVRVNIGSSSQSTTCTSS